MTKSHQKEVALFVTCLIDNVRPGIGFSVVTLLEQSGYSVVVPERQTCCGQPNYNGGDKDNALKVARQVIDVFLPYKYVVVASGSCGGMIKQHYPDLLADDSEYRKKAEQLADKVYELSCFLTEVVCFKPEKTEVKKVTYHDACAGLRELKIKDQPRQLLKQAGAEIVEMSEPEVCCGFGGTFCVKYPDISNRMVEKKGLDALNSGADALVSGDLGCILNMEGKLHRDGHDLPVYHYAELLAQATVKKGDY
ncbi:MAG TPA: (Fe-S)-binding protein [Pseudomonadales bacterium]|jgi:L-lactate dehydrogenase complex protein LldE|nr:(Fe-S)-binding protein [Pseudomonadales bacterium]